jgi:FdhD protein
VKTHQDADLTIREKGASREETMALVAEEPLSIRIHGNPYSVVMRTPGDEKAHVAGFCLAEGIIDSPADVVSIGFCDGDDTNVVTVTLTADRREKIPAILDRRNFVSQTSCGLCGKELVDDLYQMLTPVQSGSGVDIDTATAGLLGLSSHQPLRARTKASHAAVLFNAAGDPLAAAEDVGRHNALDKAIGKLFLENRLMEVAFAALSSRISYELVQKAARARIPVILAVSRPTSLAVQLAGKLNMTLASLSPHEGLFIYCGRQRFSV